MENEYAEASAYTGGSLLHFALTVVLWLLLAADVILVMPTVMFMCILILAFGFDSPYRSVFFPWVVLLLPVSALAATVAGALCSLWLWQRPRWRHASFPLGFILLGTGLELWHRFGPVF